MKTRSALALSAAVLLVGCGITTQPSSPQQEEASVDNPSMQNEQTETPPIVRETKNVTYEGVVKAAGISIYQEGSHRLQLDDGLI